MPERVDLLDSSYKRFADRVLDAVHSLTSEKRLSRIAYVVERAG